MCNLLHQEKEYTSFIMVEFTLPKNSKVVKGIDHSLKNNSENTRKLIIYRWDPEEDKNPRLDRYEIDLNK